MRQKMAEQAEIEVEGEEGRGGEGVTMTVKSHS